MLLLSIGILAMGSGDYRVSAPAIVEGAVQRAVVAPFEGYIATAGVRAGQQVEEGALLARLDDRELQNERHMLDMGLDDVVRQLSDQHGIRLVNRANTDSPVTINIRGISLRSALEIILHELDLRCELDNDSLVVRNDVD